MPSRNGKMQSDRSHATATFPVDRIPRARHSHFISCSSFDSAFAESRNVSDTQHDTTLHGGIACISTYWNDGIGFVFGRAALKLHPNWNRVKTNFCLWVISCNGRRFVCCKHPASQIRENFPSNLRPVNDRWRWMAKFKRNVGRTAVDWTLWGKFAPKMQENWKMQKGDFHGRFLGFICKWRQEKSQKKQKRSFRFLLVAIGSFFQCPPSLPATFLHLPLKKISISVDPCPR